MDPLETIDAIFQDLQEKVHTSQDPSSLQMLFENAKRSVMSVAFSHQFVEFEIVTLSENIIPDPL